LAENRLASDSRLWVARERDGHTFTTIAASEAATVPAVRIHVAPNTIVHADEAAGLDRLHAHYEMHRINHSIAYSPDGACTNPAESFFSHLRCVAPRSASITTLTGNTLVPMPGRWLGRRTIDGYPTGRCTGWRWTRRCGIRSAELGWVTAALDLGDLIRYRWAIQTRDVCVSLQGVLTSMSDRPIQTYAVPAGQPINAAYFYASSFSIQASANDFSVIFHDTLPIADNDGGVSKSAEYRRPVGIIKMSPQSAKDLALLLMDAVSKYETLYEIALVTDASPVKK
jgi:hypothetical protein